MGLKHDEGKLFFSCVTRGFAKPLRELAKVMTFGAKKYKRDSWQTVENAQERYEDALDRHLNAWKAGEMSDSESGIHHLAHAAANIFFLLHFEIERAERVERDYQNRDRAEGLQEAMTVEAQQQSLRSNSLSDTYISKPYGQIDRYLDGAFVFRQQELRAPLGLT